MKRVLVLLLSMMLLVSLAACSDSGKMKDSSTQAPTEKLTGIFTENATEEPTEEPTEDPTEEPTEAERYYINSNADEGSEFKGAVSEIVVSLDGDNVSLNDKASVLLDNGWEFDGDYKIKSHTKMAATPKKDGHRFSIMLTNFTDSSSTFRESTITKIDILLRDNDFVIKDNSKIPSFTLNGIINNDSKKSDIIEAFGEPTHITNTEDYEKLIYKDSESNKLEFYLLKKSNNQIGEVELYINTNVIK